MGLGSLFSKNKTRVDTENGLVTAKSDNLVAEISNWYTDRYGKMLIQRNILFIMLVGALFLVLFSVIQVSNISSLYQIKPFVIDLDPQSGITKIVNPLANKELLTNEAINQYFVMKYINARESYCATDYKYNYLTVVRLLSNPAVYSAFKRYINSDPKTPLLVYGKATCTSVKLRSIQFFSEQTENSEKVKQTAVVRFTVTDSSGMKDFKIYKISSLEYTYAQMQMSTEDRIVNPLGFQILNYKVDPELLTNE